MKKFVFLTLFAAAAVTATAQTDVTAYTPGITAEGVTYCLPRTALKITVTATEQIFVPGEFSRYAERYLKLSGLSDKEQHTWTITGIEVEPYGTPDSGQMYTIKIDPKSAASRVQLTKDGLIAAINTQVSSVPNTPAPAAQPQAKSVNPHDYLTEDILLAGSTAKMAELTAKEIFDIRESRNEITRGQADYIPNDGESLKFLLQNLEKQENALMLLFTGETKTMTHTASYVIIPQESLTKKVLFRLSDKLGLTDAENLAGAPVYIDIQNLNLLPVPVESGKKASSKSAATGVRYCVPGRAAVKIYDNLSTYYDREISIAQFGNTETLATGLFSKSATTKVIFDTATGNVKSIEE